MQNYFRSWSPYHSAIDFLASTNSNIPDIYVDNNDYLHLSFDPRLSPTEISTMVMENQQILKQGSDNVQSAVFLKEDSLQYKVSDVLAKRVLKKESVYLAQSGYAANYGLLRAVVIPSKTHVYIDARAHESLWQGASLGIIHKIKHNSLDDLKQKLDKYGTGIIAIDSLYSAAGSIADITEICKLKNKYDCMLVVDESHALGLHGENGSGIVAHFGVTDSVDFITGSLAKAHCVRAGFVAGRANEVLYTRDISSSAIFSSSLMTWDLCRLQRAIEVIDRANVERQRLFHISKVVRQYALELQFDVPETCLPSPILCLVGGPRDFAKKLQRYFEGAGISGAMFIPPATPLNGSVYRLTMHAGLSDDDVKRIIDVLKLIKERRHEFPYTFK